jgi:FkbM family methyltransferase
MNISYVIPLIWKHRRSWFSGGKSMLLELGWARLRIRPQSYDLYVLGEVFWEKIYTPCLGGVSNSAVILDLGANIGAFSLWAARNWHPSRIVAVEMEQDNFRLLEQNIRLNELVGKVMPVNIAIWDTNGRVGIRRHSFNHGKDQAILQPVDDGVPSITLERLMDQCGLDQIDLLKMDIEGAEQRLFNPENEHIFQHAVGHLITELHPTKGTDVPGVVAYLKQLGFRVHIRRQWLRLSPLLEAMKDGCQE